ncbi:MAG: NYN domain-containing protein [Tissierellales bacterium]|nr:NYN domain-containing protein [Tissierellales bacterium]
MAFSIVVDGHNFINDLNRQNMGKDYVLNILSFPVLHAIIQNRLKSEGLYSHPFIHTEFICSDHGEIGPFKGDERKELVKKLRNEKGVTILEVPHHTKKQKGVDLTVFIRMMTLARSPMQPHEIVLFSSDTDYVPAIRLLSEQGIHVVIVGFKTGSCSLNEGLVNESYLSLDLGELLKDMEKASDNKANSADAKSRAAD